MRVDQVLLAPVMTEKTTQMGGGKYTFLVHGKATKKDVAAAVEAFYKVLPVKVHVINTAAKFRMGKGGAQMKKKPEQRKAIVTLEAGKTIDFNQMA